MKTNFGEIDKLLNKYWEGESSLEEESRLREYFMSQDVHEDHEAYRGLFVFFKKQSEVTYNGKIQTKRSKVRPLTFRNLRVAASILLLIGAAALIYNYVDNPAVGEEDNWAKYELNDPEEAKAVAVDALAFLSSKFQKGENSVKQKMKSVGKMPIQ